MYSPPGRKEPAARHEGQVHVHGGAALQRPFELVPREVLPDGGLGAGGISQFPPDHLWGGRGAAVRGRPSPSRPWGPVGTDCPVAQDRLRPPEPWGREGAQRRPSGPVCARPPSPPHSPPRHRSHRCGPGLTAVQWGLPPRGGGVRQRRGTQDTLPRAGPGRSPRDPPSLLAPSRFTGTARTDQANGRRTLCLPEAPEGPSFSKPRHPWAGGCCRAERVPRAPTV